MFNATSGVAMKPPFKRRIGAILAIAVGIATAIAGALRASSAQAEVPAAGNSFAVHDVAVFDGNSLRAHLDVLVSDGRIAAVGPHLSLPKGVAVIDGAGKTLLPGLIDAHTHTWGVAGREALRFGVTTELDMFTDARALPAAKAQRESRGPVQGADLWSAGTLATAPGGHGTEYGMKIPTLSAPSEADAFVAQRVAEGSDYLKIVIEDGSAYGHPIPTLDAATVRALAEAARARGLMSVAHVATEQGAAEAFDAGVTGLAHVFVDRALDPKADAAFIEQARHHFVVPTLAVQDSLSGAGAAGRLAADARLLPFLSADQLASLKTAFPPGWTQPRFMANAIANVRVLHQAGVPLLAGTDAGNPGTAHGASLHGELALLVQAGLSPTEALRAATAEPARIFGLSDRGRIAPGLRADLLLVEGDPTTDIQATRAIAALWKNGYAVDRSLHADEKPSTTAATRAPADPLIADFEEARPAARFGQAFAVTTDQLAGGKSTATQAWMAGGAAGSKGALQVQGVIDGGLPYAWAGTMWMAGSAPMQPLDFSGRKELVFKVRGDERMGVAMIFSGASAQGRPAMLPFKITADWAEVRLPLERFAGADLAALRAIAFTTGLPAGSFSFAIDDVSIR
jgi:imidazolonepropionase-like amidohydrolase